MFQESHPESALELQFAFPTETPGRRPGRAARPAVNSALNHTATQTRQSHCQRRGHSAADYRPNGTGDRQYIVFVPC